MNIRRGSLIVGVFLLAIGGVTLANAVGALDRTAVADTVRTLWPLAVIAIGLALALRHTSAALPAGVAAAAVPGLLLGGAFVAIPPVPSPCTPAASLAGPHQTREGTSADGARIVLRLACGELTTTTGQGDAWRLESSDGAGRQTVVTEDSGGFTATSDGAARGWTVRRQPVRWTATLPTAVRLDLSTQVDAGRARLDLGGARLGTLELGVDAGDLRADLTGASLDRLTVAANAGSVALTLPDATFSGSVSANAGSVRLCTPAGLAVRIHSTASLGAVHVNGLVQHGDVWSSPDTTNANATADLTLSASVGSVTVNPQGGCQ
jgi:hypothetical protein